MDKTKLNNSLKKFEEYLVVDRGLAPVTVKGYRSCLSIAIRRIKKFVPNKADIKAYILWLHEKQYSYSHIVNSSLALEHFAKFKGFDVVIGRPKKPKRILKDTLSESEVSRLIQSAKNLREKCMISFLAYSGIRNLELCNLRVVDIDLGANKVRILAGKGIKDRIVNVPAQCTRLLVEYIMKYSRKSEDFLFTTIVKGNPMATGDIRKIVRVLAKRANIGRRVFPHLLRHSLATNLLNRGASLLTIKDQLGHAHLATVLHYLSCIETRVKTEYEHFLPAYM